MFVVRDLGISVSIVTRPQAGRPGNRGSIPDWNRCFRSVDRFETISQPHSAFCTVGTGFLSVMPPKRESMEPTASCRFSRNTGCHDRGITWLSSGPSCKYKDLATAVCFEVIFILSSSHSTILAASLNDQLRFLEQFIHFPLFCKLRAFGAEGW